MTFNFLILILYTRRALTARGCGRDRIELAMLESQAQTVSNFHKKYDLCRLFRICIFILFACIIAPCPTYVCSRLGLFCRGSNRCQQTWAGWVVPLGKGYVREKERLLCCSVCYVQGCIQGGDLINALWQSHKRNFETIGYNTSPTGEKRNCIPQFV